MAMSEKAVKRIFVVEQSARGLGGHHLEYAMRIADNSGFFEKHLVVSRRFERQGDYDGLRIHASYKYGYWDIPGKNLIKFLQKIAKANKLNLQRSWKIPKGLVRLQYTFSTFRQPEVFFSLFKEESNWPPKISINKVLAFSVLSILLLPIATFMLILRMLKRIFSLKLSRKISSKAINLLKKIVDYILLLATLHSLRMKFRQFGKDTKRLFKQNLLTESDLLFFGTIGQIELSALNQVLHLQKSKPKCLVILRREPHENGNKPWNWQNVSRNSRANSIEFYADTLELAKAYSELFGFTVEVFPIPAGHVNTSLKLCAKEYEISYLGDARSEKGFESFSSLVADIPKSKIFTQLNHARELDPVLALALQSVLRSESEKVLEPMDSITYLESISKSELLWIGYLGENYEKRSSGIFIEGTIRGIPSLVTDGSWMHAEIYRNSIEYWKESMKETSMESLNLHRGVVQLLTFPGQKVEVEFTLSTGITLVSTGWSDSDGFAYIVLPLLNKSESIQRVNFLNSTLKLTVVGFAEMSRQSLWVGGVVLNNPDRAHLAFNEYRDLKNSYDQFTSRISEYLKFHSDSNIKYTLEKVLK